jgi:hypothetical protein
MVRRTEEFPSGAGILAAALLAVAALPAAARAQSPIEIGTREWRRRSVAPSSFQDSSLALGAAGQPHFGVQSPSFIMLHAWLDGRKKYIERADPLPDSGFASAIAVDSPGGVHLAYVADRRGEVPGFRLVYGFSSAAGSGWTLTDLDSGGFSPSIALDAVERPHLAYVDGQSRARYASFDGTSWQFVTLAEGALDFGETSIALADSGAVHVTFSDASLPRRLFWATNAGGELEVEKEALRLVHAST